MYIPKPFLNEDRESMYRLIREYPLAVLVTDGADGPCVDHVPMVLDAQGKVLRGHIARVNPLARQVAEVRALTEQQEAGAPAPWAVGDAPAQYIGRLAAAIIGIELSIETLEGKWKVSQNQTAETRVAVAHGLRERNRGADLVMADLVCRSPE